jgi:hypothetical protein
VKAYPVLEYTSTRDFLLPTLIELLFPFPTSAPVPDLPPIIVEGYPNDIAEWDEFNAHTEGLWSDGRSYMVNRYDNEDVVLDRWINDQAEGEISDEDKERFLKEYKEQDDLIDALIDKERHYGTVQCELVDSGPNSQGEPSVLERVGQLLSGDWAGVIRRMNTLR